jgi:deoxyribose-phosphate aldolase
MMELNRIIDHTLLKPEATYREIENLCREAEEYNFAAVCVNPVHVRLAAELLRARTREKTGIKVCTVIGFPLGATVPLLKALEVREAIANGATEVDMVMNIGALKSGDYELVFRDIKAVVDAAAGQALTKVIIEACLLTDEEKIKACLLAKEAGAGFVKTSTGFNKSGATVEDVALLRKVAGAAMGVKASGGIRDRRTAEAMVKAGANRLGTSAGVAIMREGASFQNNPA